MIEQSSDYEDVFGYLVQLLDIQEDVFYWLVGFFPLEEQVQAVFLYFYADQHYQVSYFYPVLIKITF